MRGKLPLLVLLVVLLAGCRAGTASQELEQLRARTSTLEAENAHLLGQVSLVEAERDQLRQQVNTLATDLAKAQAGAGVGGTTGAAVGTAVAASENLVVVPREVYPGEWVAVHIRNYPVRLLSLAGVALRGSDGKNLTHIKQLAVANVFLLPIPQNLAAGTYSVVLGEAGTLGPQAQIDDQVSVVIRSR